MKSKKTYCGLDFHKNVCELCMMDENGKGIDRFRMDSKKLLTFMSNRRNHHIAIESSGGVFDISAKLEAQGHKVTIINASQFRGIGISGKKNDRNDAEALATALRLGFVPEVHAKTLYSRRVKSLLASREQVVRTRTGITNHVRGILREYGLPMPAGQTAFWNQVTGRIRALDCGVIEKVLQGLVDQAAEMIEKENHIEEMLLQLTKDDERIARLETVPGVGRLSATAFVATTDDVTRFDSSRHVGSYLGLTPRENSSGNKTRFGGITKCGPELCRRYFIHGARASMRYAPKPENKVRCWAGRLEKRVGTNKAVVALAHKNVRICFALLRDGTTYGGPRKKRSQLIEQKIAS